MRQDWEPEDLIDLVAGSEDETGEGGDGEGAVSGGGRSHFAELKADQGAPGLESLLAEVNKLQRVRRLELPADLFGDVSEKLVEAWRARASKEYPANLERMKPPRRLTLLAALCHVAADGDHRLAGGPVHSARAEDQHPGGAKGRQGAQRRAEEDPGQGRDAAAGR